MAEAEFFNLEDYGSLELEKLLAPLNGESFAPNTDLYDLTDLLVFDGSGTGTGSTVTGPVSISNRSDPYLIETRRPSQRRTESRSSDEGLGRSPMSDQNSSTSGFSPISRADMELPGDSVPDPELLNPRGGPTPDLASTNRLEDTKPLVNHVDGDSVGPMDCYVCKEKAGKHSYYGGRVCPSCRAFFRRAVQSKYYEIFFCSKGEKCEINLKTRRSCQYCRFKKCLQSGMRIAWVLPDGERNRRFNKLNKVKQRNKITVDDTKKTLIVPLKRAEPVVEVTNEEWALIESTHNFLSNFFAKSMQEYMFANPQFMKELATLCYFGGKLNYEFYRAFNGMCDKFMTEFFFTIDEVKKLSDHDKRELIRINGALINRFKCSVTIQEENSCLANGLDRATKSGEFPQLNEIHDRLKELNLENRRPLFAYNQFYSSPWAANYDDEKKHFALMLKMKALPRDNKDSPVDETQMSLIKLVMAFSTDFVTLERRDVVEKAQLRYASLLQRYLKYKYGGPEANKRFAAAMMMTSYARESHEIQERRLPV